jgi:hypothetical protein
VTLYVTAEEKRRHKNLVKQCNTDNKESRKLIEIKYYQKRNKIQMYCEKQETAQACKKTLNTLCNHFFKSS